MIGIVDYGVANLGSMRNMLQRIGASAVLVSSPRELAQANKIILPGIGSFDHGVEALRSRELDVVLRERVLGAGIPILGVCLGAQLLGLASEEGDRPGLGLIEAHCMRFSVERLGGLPVPHMGWSELRMQREHQILTGLGEEARFYFVHSYHLVCADVADVLATATYGHEFTAIVQRGNIIGAQFHPEKSHRFGMQLLRNFAGM